MGSSPLLNELINALQFLPGIGPKSAQRMAYFMIEKEHAKSRILINALSQCLEKIDRCKKIVEHLVNWKCARSVQTLEEIVQKYAL